MTVRCFIDMDGVIVDFQGFMDLHSATGDQVKAMPGAYLKMEPIPCAIPAVRSVIGMGFDVYLATKPPTGLPFAYADKVSWVLQHLPELKRKIILTHDKGLLGGEHDILIDDRIHKANCGAFRGLLINHTGWDMTLAVLRNYRSGL